MLLKFIVYPPEYLEEKELKFDLFLFPLHNQWARVAKYSGAWSQRNEEIFLLTGKKKGSYIFLKPYFRLFPFPKSWESHVINYLITLIFMN